jgi:hypothetical protein
MKYFAYGNYGYKEECLLEEFNSAAEGSRWLKNYARDGYLGGYFVIEIASFADDGEYIVHDSLELEDEWLT